MDLTDLIEALTTMRSKHGAKDPTGPDIQVIAVGEGGDVANVEGVEFNNDDGPAIIINVGPWS